MDVLKYCSIFEGSHKQQQQDYTSLPAITATQFCLYSHKITRNYKESTIHTNKIQGLCAGYTIESIHWENYRAGGDQNF